MQTFDLQAQLEDLLEELGLEASTDQSPTPEFDLPLASDFAHELLDLLDQHTRSRERALPRHWSRIDRREVAREQAMVYISSMVIEMALQYPEWCSTLLDRIAERRDLAALNGRTLHDSFPEVPDRD